MAGSVMHGAGLFWGFGVFVFCLLWRAFVAIKKKGQVIVTFCGNDIICPKTLKRYKVTQLVTG